MTMVNKFFKPEDKKARLPENSKGGFMGICNRGACDTKPAVWWNTVMRKHYCERCAESINKSADSCTYHDGSRMERFVHLDKRIADKIPEEKAKHCDDEDCKGKKEDCFTCKWIQHDMEMYGEPRHI